MLFNPTQQEVRAFFCGVYAKHLAKSVLTPLENIAARWLVEHPEYHRILADEPAAQAAHYPPEAGQTNPFLHLSMHLTISEQVQVDQPAGVKALYGDLLEKTQSSHDAHHYLMEGLGEMLWQAQRNQSAPDADVYFAATRRAARLVASD